MSTSNFKGIVKLTEEQYQELSTNNILTTSSGTTINYDPTSTLYITPDIPSELALINKDNQFTVGQTINGNLTVNGDIIQSGSSYETHAEEIYSTKDYIYLREGAVSGLTSGQYSGLEFINYDGTNNGRLVIDNTGTVRVGDVGEERPLAVRGESPIDGGIAIWNNDTKTFDTNNTYTYNNLVIKSNLNNYVDLTSSQNITGQKTFTKELILEQTSGYRGFRVNNTDVTRGQAIESATGAGRLIFYDNQNNILGYVQSIAQPDGTTQLQLLAGGNTNNANLYLNAKPDGTTEVYTDDTIRLTRGSTRYLDANNGAVPINLDRGGGVYNMLAKMKSTNGVFLTGTYQHKFMITYTSNETIKAGTNAVDKQWWFNEDGSTVTQGVLTANELNLTKTGYPNISGATGVYISSDGNWGGSGGEFCFTSTEFRPSNARSNKQTLGTSTSVWKQGYFGDQGVTIGNCTLSYNSTNSALEFNFN